MKVRATACATCIYRKDSPLDLVALEDACCRGFWNRHKDEFPLGQIAQRLGFVQFVDEEIR